ncbi:hypothetical protein MPDQ_000916 [Monascus purpureus]|uniref:Uncharacterized protein n=1 Tax=Monascus purpureus TaxID=5098 RepID=A0A507QNQ6_MONPU|nr:hypothetical protein MPDQ_000916 [Monascus purpureus]BDD62567.1 hypothetical protein MAP00_007535 [Monascus purpureus]
MQPSYSPSDKGTESIPESRNAVESPPAEGDVAAAVRRKGDDRVRAQAGAHAGPVGSARGPGDPGFGEEKDLVAEMSRKEREHQEVLEQRESASRSQFSGGIYGREGEEQAVERERVREQKMRRDREIDVAGAVKKGTGNVVSGD